MSEHQKLRLREMGWQLNDLVMDLKTPVDVAMLLRVEARTNLEAMSLSRMVLGALFVNLCKLLEIANHYGKEVRDLPDDIRVDLLEIKRKIEEKGIYQYRSTYIAHAFIQEKGQPKRALSFREATQALQAIIDEGLTPVMENVHAFCRWIYEQDDQRCVVNVIYRTVRAVEASLGGLGIRV
ncbi:hypothetical protein [Caballeronia sp. AZ1_KS37]|uniref:hypothetical protein n=1 Tax=Caballeronia sp. AZ1_KS37 TaxID=2921756 RepID=UPI002027CFCC|nr:hypothetical protein [Caballeronia sp. AZ1_KS37]